MQMIDWSIRLGDLVVLGGLAGSVIIWAFKAGGFARSIEAMQEEIKGLKEIVTKVAVQNQRLDTQDRRLDEHTRIIEDLRRGEGMILPLAEALRGRGRGPT